MEQKGPHRGRARPLSTPYVMPVLTEQQQVDLVVNVTDARKYESRPWVKFRIQDVQQPRSGCLCHGPAWWCVTACGCVLAHNSTLQCNPNEQMAETLRAQLHRSCTLRYFDMLYIPISSWEIRK